MIYYESRLSLIYRISLFREHSEAEMSHYTTVKDAEMVCLDTLNEALEDLWGETSEAQTCVVIDQDKWTKMGKKGKPICRGWHGQKPREVDIVVRVKNGLENEEKQGAKYCDIGFIAHRDKDGNVTEMECVGDEYALRASNYPTVTGEVSNKTEKIGYYGKQALRAYRESDVCRKFNRNRTLKKRNRGKNWRRGQFKTVTKNGKKVRTLVVNQ